MAQRDPKMFPQIFDQTSGCSHTLIPSQLAGEISSNVIGQHAAAPRVNALKERVQAVHPVQMDGLSGTVCTHDAQMLDEESGVAPSSVPVSESGISLTG